MKKYLLILVFFFACSMVVQKILAQESETIINKISDANFKHNLLKHAMLINKEHVSKSNDRKTESITFLILKESIKLNCLVIKEAMQNGQLIKKMNIILSNHGTEIKNIAITTIGKKRVVTFATKEVTELSFVITSSIAKPKLDAIEGYLIDENLIEKE